MTWKKVAEKGAIADGKGKAFKIDGKQIAIFNQDGYHAIDDLCVHPHLPSPHISNTSCIDSWGKAHTCNRKLAQTKLGILDLDML